LHEQLRGPLAAAAARQADRAGETASRVYSDSDGFGPKVGRAGQLAVWVERVLMDSGLLRPSAPRG